MEGAIFTIVFIIMYLVLKDSLSDLAFQSLPLYLLVMVPILIALSYMGLFFKNQDRTKNQKTRTTKAGKELQPLGVFDKSNEHYSPKDLYKKNQMNTNIYLFLRPFLADTIDAKNPELNSCAARYIPLYKFILPDVVSVDDVLRKALPNKINFIALSTKTEDIGAVKIACTEENWKDRINKLAIHAEIILIIPGERSGTAWEIQRLIELGLLSRCLFLLLPLPSSLKFEFQESMTFDAILKVFQQNNLLLPEIGPYGQIIELGDVIAFDESKKIRFHKKKVISQRWLSVEFNLKKMKECIELLKN